MEKQTAQTDGQRLQQVLDMNHISANRLAKLLGKTPASLYHILEGRNTLSHDMAENIIHIYENISYAWLKRGKGDPLLKTEEEKRAQRKMFLKPSEKFEDVDKLIEHNNKPEPDFNYYHLVQELIYEAKKNNELISNLLQENKEIKSLLASKV